MDHIETKIRDLVETLLTDDEIKLVDVVLRGQKGTRVLNIYADTVSGIRMDQIARLTRGVNDLLDVHDVVPGKYRLEISSPGVDRPLKALWEFQKNIGRKLKVVYDIDEEVQETVGSLLSTTSDEIVIKEKKESVHIPIASIRTAKVQLKW